MVKETNNFKLANNGYNVKIYSKTDVFGKTLYGLVAEFTDSFEGGVAVLESLQCAVDCLCNDEIVKADRLRAENQDLKERNEELSNRINSTVVKLCDAYSGALSRLESARLTNEELRMKNDELETELQQCKVRISDLEKHMNRYNELLSGTNN